MSKRKRSKEDRLSELPDSLIFDIFRFLPMTDVVRTTVLSTRWKNLWITVPYLNVEYNKMIDTDKVRSFVNRALSSWKGFKIMRFNVKFNSKFEKSDIDSWLHSAMEKNVEELVLLLPNLYLVPQYLYSCSSLRILELRNCDLRIHGNVQWNKLMKLTIHNEGINQNAINQILCGSPLLEDLFITLGHIKTNLSIRSTNLKTLSIFKRVFVALSKDSELRIWTPNLKNFFMSGAPYSKCLLMNVSSLTEAFLKFDRPRPSTWNVHSFPDKALSQILSTIKYVERVTLSDWCIKMLGDLKKKPSPFHNAEFLELNSVSCVNYQQIAGVLGIFPKLKNLVIQSNNYSLSALQYAESCLKLGYASLLQLRTIDVTFSVDENSIFLLIEVLLNSARNLEKMVFRVRQKRSRSRTPWNSLFKVSQKLLRMQISSPTAELIFRSY